MVGCPLALEDDRLVLPDTIGHDQRVTRFETGRQMPDLARRGNRMLRGLDSLSDEASQKQTDDEHHRTIS